MGAYQQLSTWGPNKQLLELKDTKKLRPKWGITKA